MSYNKRIKGEIRRAQLISTYGIGAMVAAGDESFMVSVADDWPIGNEDWQHPEEDVVIHEPRLEKMLGVQRFMLPPSRDEDSLDVPVVRFPEYYYCPNCRKLDWHKGLTRDSQSSRCERCNVDLVPSRFVIACRAGHISDFPYHRWLHIRGSGGDKDCRVFNKMTIETSGESASLGSIKLKCSACAMVATLEGVFGADALKPIVGHCDGKRPWIGDSEECSEIPQVLQRGASNVWFPMVASAVSIPPWSNRAAKVVQRHWSSSIEAVVGCIPEEQWPALLSNLAKMNGVPAEALIIEVKRKMSFDLSEAGSDEDLRRGEYEALRRGTDETNSSTDFECSARDFDGPGETPLFRLASAVERLREVRALTRFTRLAPPLSAYDKGQPVALRRRDWLPAVEVRGEGVFLEFAPEAIAEWESRDSVKQRVATMAGNYEKAMKRREAEPQFVVSPKFVMIHTFAHALITQWAMDSGYAAAELRERLYFEEDMAGVLVYTASGDSAGSLGGVVAQSRPGRLEAGVAEAIRRAAWCSADPLCVEADAQGVDSLNLAACHSCVLLPEVSCEQGNRFLDRALLIGKPDDPSLGYFERWV